MDMLCQKVYIWQQRERERVHRMAYGHFFSASLFLEALSIYIARATWKSSWRLIAFLSGQGMGKYKCPARISTALFRTVSSGWQTWKRTTWASGRELGKELYSIWGKDSLWFWSGTFFASSSWFPWWLQNRLGHFVVEERAARLASN